MVRSTVAAGALAALLFLGCSEGARTPLPDGASPTAMERQRQPVANVVEFGVGPLEEIPLPPGSGAAADLSVLGNVATASYRIQSLSPRDILRFYEERLGGWRLVSPVQRTDDTSVAYRGAWEMTNGTRLEVTSVELVDPAATAELTIVLHRP